MLKFALKIFERVLSKATKEKYIEASDKKSNISFN